MSQLKKGAVLNYTTIILTNIVGLLLTPFIIGKLGDSEFGLYTLIGALVGYISLLDFGLSNTVIRFVAKYRAEQNRVEEENFLATTMLIYLSISFIILIVGSICYLNLEDIFKDSLTLEQVRRAKIMFVILIFNLAICLPCGVFNGICIGYEQFVFPKSINIIRYIVRSLTIVTVLMFGGKAISMVIVDTLMNLFVIIANAGFVFKKLKVSFKLHYFKFLVVKKIFSYSFWIFISAIVALFQWQSGQVILGVLTNTNVVAIYAIGIVLGSYYGTFSSAISGVFLPRATQMTVANASPKELTDMMIKIGRISFISLLYILGAFILFGKQFVFLWVGETYFDSWVIALIIMFAYTIPLTQSFGILILEASNRVSFKAVMFLIFFVIGTIIGGFLSKKFGAIGMISGIVLGWFIVQNIMNYYYHKVLGINILRFFKELFNKTLLIFVLILGIGYLISYLPGDSWLNFFLKAIMYSVVYFALMYYKGSIEFEKLLFNKSIGNLKNKIIKKRTS
ncbi:oligosaccharide flippase family protein [uncultured Wocania sp.]|uniref:lipopolysaccharide biosynthesis protein n=1 Tax=uncultured Wocania sp. TaxID=2834404 RepID=UPI0030F4F30E